MRVGIFHAYDPPGRPPAGEHARACETREYGDEWDTASRRRVLPGRIITHVKPAARDNRSEARDRSVPDFRRRTGLGYSTFHPLGFFASGASIDGQRQADLR